MTNVALVPEPRPVAPGHQQARGPAGDRARASTAARSRKIGEGGQQPAGQPDRHRRRRRSTSTTTRPRWPPPATTSRTRTRPSSCWPSAGYSPSHPLKLTVITITGYTDWDASLAVIKQQLAPIGIDLTVQDLAPADLRRPAVQRRLRPRLLRRARRPDAVLRAAADAATRRTRAPLGKQRQQQLRALQQPRRRRAVRPVPGGRRRPGSRDHQADRRRRCSRTSRSSRRPSRVDWFQYNTKDIGGWPTEDDPYAQPAAFNVPDVEQVLLHLYAAK